jgi:hypothetical protein
MHIVHNVTTGLPFEQSLECFLKALPISIRHSTFPAQDQEATKDTRDLCLHYHCIMIRRAVKITRLACRILALCKGKGFALQAWSGSWGSRSLRILDRLDFRHYECCKVVTLTHRPPSPPGVFLVLIFRGWVDPRAHGSVGSFEKNPQWHHWESIPIPSD